MSELKQKKTTDFDSMRKAMVSVDVQNSNSEKLSIPLLNRALINFPAQGANEQESNILTSLFVLILLSVQMESPAKSSVMQRKLKMTKARRNTTEIKFPEVPGKEAENKKIGKPLTRTASYLALRPESFEHTKTDVSLANQCSSSQQTDYDKTGQFRPTRQEQLNTRNEPLSSSWNLSSLEFQPLKTTSQETYSVRPSRMRASSLMSLKNTTVVFNLAVNGRPYGNIVFELRPEYTFCLNRNRN
jgi:hypothetical protein